MSQDPESTERAKGRRGAPISLEARALALLARREFSRFELRARLEPHAPDGDTLDALLDRLVARRLLSDQRFVESLVRRRSGRFGTARIRHELRGHQLPAEQLESAVQALKSSEFDRALEVWRKRFGEPAASRDERLRQMRFLAGRGFAAEVIRRVVAGGHDAEIEAADEPEAAVEHPDQVPFTPDRAAFDPDFEAGDWASAGRRRSRAD